MLPEIAHFQLILALAFAVLCALLPMLGSYIHDVRLMRSAKWLSIAQAFFATVSMLILIKAFLNDDFSVKIISQTSNSLLPWYYKITALWGGHEGSLLLWMVILAWWQLAVALLSKNMPDDLTARVLSVMSMVFIGFALFALLTSSPFERVLPDVPLDGRDLNPLLQDFGMIIHPPMLYFGYVGFSVAFAFAIAALLSGEFDATWLRWLRPWTTAAWGFLTLGIALGSWWAYYELGWGGWWFWDPVENASFMPWLMGTALIHSLAVSEKRGLFKSWTILLAIFTFSLSLLGTFIVRSGVLTSVHAFASDPERGLFILYFLALVIGGSLLLFALRAPQVLRSGSFSVLSKEMFLLLNNIVLVVACLTVFVGTLFPLFADAFNWGKYSVGPPYFNQLFVPLMALLMVLLGFGSSLLWKKTRGDKLKNIIKQLALFTLVAWPVLLLIIQQGFAPEIIAVTALCAWLVAATLLDISQRLKNKEQKFKNLLALPKAFWGMQLAHLGLAVTALGIVVVSNNDIKHDVTMTPGQVDTLGAYEVKFLGSEEVEGPNYRALQGHFELSQNGKTISELHPQKRFYHSQAGNVMTEAAINARLSRDLYVAMGESLDNGSWSLTLQYKPFVRLIWLGALMMVLGAILALLDSRYKSRG